jgi:hypothetical protein
VRGTALLAEELLVLQDGICPMLLELDMEVLRKRRVCLRPVMSGERFIFQESDVPQVIHGFYRVLSQATSSLYWKYGTVTTNTAVLEICPILPIYCSVNTAGMNKLKIKLVRCTFCAKFVLHFCIIFLRNDIFSIHQTITNFQNFVTFASFLTCLYISEQLKDDVIPYIVLTINKVLKLCHGCFSVASWLWCTVLSFRVS